jgi:hypothetical protein
VQQRPGQISDINDGLEGLKRSVEQSAENAYNLGTSMQHTIAQLLTNALSLALFFCRIFTPTETQRRIISNGFLVKYDHKKALPSSPWKF